MASSLNSLRIGTGNLQSHIREFFSRNREFSRLLLGVLRKYLHMRPQAALRAHNIYEPTLRAKSLA